MDVTWDLGIKLGWLCFWDFFLIIGLWVVLIGMKLNLNKKTLDLIYYGGVVAFSAMWWDWKEPYLMLYYVFSDVDFDPSLVMIIMMATVGALAGISYGILWAIRDALKKRKTQSASLSASSPNNSTLKGDSP